MIANLTGAAWTGCARRRVLPYGIYLQWRHPYRFSGGERVLRDQRLHHDPHYAAGRRAVLCATPGADRAALLAVHVERAGGGLAVEGFGAHLDGRRNRPCPREP